MLSFGDDTMAKQYLLGLNLSQWEYNQYYSIYEEQKKAYADKYMNEAYFTAAMRSIAVQLESGNADFIAGEIDDMWPNLSPAQRRKANELLAMYGYEHTDEG